MFKLVVVTVQPFRFEEFFTQKKFANTDCKQSKIVHCY